MDDVIKKNSVQKYVSELNACFLKAEASGENIAYLNLDLALDQTLDLILKAKSTGGKVIFIGNGGSAAIASHQAVDFWKNGKVRAIAFNDSSLLTCVSNDFGYEQVFERPIDMFAEKSDVLIAISSSGQSKNILRAIGAAKAKKCSVITLSGFKPDNPLRRKGQLNFYVPSESYGFVEISHLILCHYLVDEICMRKEPSTVQTTSYPSA